MRFLKIIIIGIFYTIPHFLRESRASGPLVSMPEFVNLYNIKPGDGMYIDPNDRVKIW